MVIVYFNETLLNDWAKFDINKRTKHTMHAISSGLAIMACNRHLYRPHADKVKKQKLNINISRYKNKGNALKTNRLKNGRINIKRLFPKSGCK